MVSTREISIGMAIHIGKTQITNICIFLDIIILIVDSIRDLMIEINLET